VYRGPAGGSDCSEAAAALLAASRWSFDVRYVGPREKLAVSPATLRAAALYVQPGGDDGLRRAWKQFGDGRADLRRYVRSGGRYVGICMGGYLAGTNPGFRLLPGDSNDYAGSRGSTVRGDDEVLVEVTWRGEIRPMYFQGGPLFNLKDSVSDVAILARYTSNNRIAALVSGFGRGVVGVCGPHPEAPQEWYAAAGLPSHVNHDLGLDLIDSVMVAVPGSLTRLAERGRADQQDGLATRSAHSSSALRGGRMDI
jgi:glutamine amidotransferase-like uncharacterized protein